MQSQLRAEQDEADARGHYSTSLHEQFAEAGSRSPDAIRHDQP